jgi:hypothetical protein
MWNIKQNKKFSIKYEVITAVVMEIIILWDITTLKVNRRFGGTININVKLFLCLIY